jgi:hypothetical protein
MSDEIKLVCNLEAIEDREAHVALAERLFSAVQETRETEDGYSFKLPVQYLKDAAAWISNERLCCPFFHFGTSLNAESDHLWLHLSGADPVKALLKAEIVGRI